MSRKKRKKNKERKKNKKIVDISEKRIYYSGIRTKIYRKGTPSLEDSWPRSGGLSAQHCQSIPNSDQYENMGNFRSPAVQMSLDSRRSLSCNSS